MIPFEFLSDDFKRIVMENNLEYAPHIGIKKSDWMRKVEKNKDLNYD